AAWPRRGSDGLPCAPRRSPRARPRLQRAQWAERPPGAHLTGRFFHCGQMGTRGQVPGAVPSTWHRLAPEQDACLTGGHALGVFAHETLPRASGEGTVAEAPLTETYLEKGVRHLGARLRLWDSSSPTRRWR